MRPHEISRSNLYKIVSVERQRSVNVDFGMDGVSGHKGSQIRGHMHGVFKALIGWWVGGDKESVISPHVEEGPNLIKFLDNLAHDLPFYVPKGKSLFGPTVEKAYPPFPLSLTLTDLSLLS